MKIVYFSVVLALSSLSLSEAQGLDMSKLTSLFGGLNTGGGLFGGGNDLLSQLTNLFSGNPLEALTNMFNQQSVGAFANRAKVSSNKLKPAQKDLRDLTSRLTELKSVMDDSNDPDEVLNELEALDVDEMLRESKKSQKRVHVARNRMRSMGSGMKALQDTMKNPEQTQKGFMKILDLGESPVRGRDAKQGTNMLNGVLKGFGTRGNSKNVLTGMFQRAARNQLNG